MVLALVEILVEGQSGETVIETLLGGLAVGLIMGLAFGLIHGVVGSLTFGEIEARTLPNQGMHRSARNALMIGLPAE
jgi:hypothetical protein